jgi:acyl-CoA thioesterase-1
MLQPLFFRRARRAVLFAQVCGLIALLAASSGCERPPRLTPLSSESRILAFGDSLTYGTGATPEQSYPAMLAQLTGAKVVNAGVPGETSAAGLRRLPQLLKQHQPQLLILCHGGNDILRRMPVDDTVSNLQTMIDMARFQNIDVLIIGVPQFGIFLSTAEFYIQLAERNHIPIDDNLLGKIMRQPALRSDHVHPNADGYALMAQSISALLAKSGALRQD